MVNMSHIVPYGKLLQLLEGDGLFLGIAIADIELMVTLQYLVISIAVDFAFRIRKTFR